MITIVKARFPILIFGLVCLFATAAYSQDAQPDEPSKRASAISPIDPSKFAVIISGVSGEPQYEKQFNTWTAELNKNLCQQLGFAKDHTTVLAEKADGDTKVSTAEEVRRAFQKLRESTKPESAVFIFFIGHGTFDGKQAKFNLVGPICRPRIMPS